MSEALIVPLKIKEGKWEMGVLPCWQAPSKAKWSSRAHPVELCQKPIACRSWFSTLWCSLQHLVSLGWLGFHLCVYFPWMITTWLLFPVGCDSVWRFSFLPESSPLCVTLNVATPAIPPLVSFFPRLTQSSSVCGLDRWDPFTPKVPTPRLSHLMHRALPLT